MKALRFALALAVLVGALVSSSAFAQCPALTVSPASLSDATTGQAYGPVAFSALPAASYTFEASGLPAGLTMSIAGSLSGTPAESGTFAVRVVATDTNGCVATHVLPLQVCEGAAVSIVADDATTCSGTNVTFTATPVNGGATPSYQWRVNGGNVGSDSPVFSSSTLANGDVVDVVMSSSLAACLTGNPATSNTVTMTVDPLPSSTITPGATAVCASSTGNTASGPAGGTLTYAWSITNGSITSATNVQNITYDAGTTSPVTLTLTVTDTVTSCLSTSNTDVTVNALPDSTITPGASAVCASSTGNTASGPAGGTLTYAWSITNGTITSATNAQNISYTAGTTSPVQLTLTVTDTATSCLSTSNANVTINPTPTLSPAPGALSGGLYLNGYSQSFTASSGTPPYTYSITAAPAGLSFDTNTGVLSGSSPTLPNTTGSFSFDVTASDANGCSVTQSYTLLIQPNTQGETYNSGVGNTQYVVTGYTPFPSTPAVANATNVLTNDVFPGPLGGLAVTGAPAHGTVDLKNDGTFLYTPNAGDTASSDSFVYTLTDANAITNTATVTINLSGMVWYVNNTIGSSGDGRSHDPFKLLSDAQGPALGKPQTGQVIYVHTGSGSTTGDLSLLANQALWGNGVAFSIGGLSLPAGTKPTLTGAVALGNDVTVTGLTFNPTGSAITSNGITGTSTIDQNTITATSSAAAVSLQNGAGTIHFTSTPISKTAGTGSGLFINAKNGGTVDFDAASPISVTSGGASGISLTNNGGTTISFAGTLTLNTTTAPAFAATGGGTVTATAAGSIVSTTTATAVNIASTSIGPGGVTFQSVAVSGNTALPSRGIILDTAGSGGFTITGTGSTAGSGGTIAQTNARGVEVLSTNNVTFKNMNLTSTVAVNGTASGTCGDVVTGNNLLCNAAIHLATVTGVTLDNLLVDGSMQAGVNGNTVTNLTMTGVEVRNAGNEVSEHGVVFRNLLGTATITGCNFHDNEARQLYVHNATGSLSSLAISSSTFANAPAPNGGQGVLLTTENAGTSMTASIAGSSFHDLFTNAVQSGANSDSTQDVTVTGSTFTNVNSWAVLQASQGSQLAFSIQSNTGSTGPLSGSGAIFIKTDNATLAPPGSVATGDITSNVIGISGVPGSGAVCGGGCSGISVNQRDGGSLTVDIVGNTIQQVDANGIYLSGGNSKPGDAGKLVAAITGNLIREPAALALNGISIISGVVSADVSCVTATIGGGNAWPGVPTTAAGTQNRIEGNWDPTPSGTGNEIFLWERFAGTSFYIPGLSGAAATFVAGLNSITSGDGTNVSTSGTFTAGTCP